MRILFWSATFSPRIGGIEVLGERFVRTLQARGHELVIIAGPYLPDGNDTESFHGIPLYRFPFAYQARPVSMEMIVRIRQRLAKLNRDFRPDLLHLFQARTAFFFQLATNNHTEPWLLTLHNSYFDGTQVENQARLRLCQEVDWTTACSHATLEETRAVVPAITANSSVIHNSLEMPLCEPAALTFDEPRILCLGRLQPEKGFQIALEAFARVHRRFPHARLLIAGDGSEKGSLEAQSIQLGIQEAVDFLGWVSPSQVPDLLNQSTLMLVPSLHESFGLVALQAAQMARPVIASRVGGLPEVVVDGESGILVEPANVDALADAMETLLSRPAYANALGAAAREHAQRNFGWTAFVDSYEELYARLVAGKARALSS